jgi:pSer/pThr/pTyr-binding forkhead associated (FHA) protein
MPITVIVRSAASDARLTFDGMQPVVVGRGASCDVRLPEPSVSHRHACIRTQGADFVLVDEGSTNGTFVGGVRIAPHTSRIVRSGDAVRVGRMWIELRIDHGPITRDVAAATRDLALALVSKAMAARGKNQTTRVHVVEGKDQGAALDLADQGHGYVVGRGAQCDLPLSDQDASREHAVVTRRGDTVVVRDIGAKNGTWLGDSRAPENCDVVWRPAQVMRIGRTVLALEEPVSEALAQVESAPDEVLPVGDPIDSPAASLAPPATAPVQVAGASAKRMHAGWSIADILVMAAAFGVLAMSIAGLFWLLRG